MRRSLLLFMTMACLALTKSASAANGLNYTYYEGNWTTMPDFSSLSAAKGGASSNLDLGVRNRDNYYGVMWQGYLIIPADGTYTFELNSDDGSKMYLGNYNSASTPFINNDGLHGNKTVSASRYLYKGVFPIAILYFQGTGVNLMELYWSSTAGISRQRVPDNALLTNYTNNVNPFSGLNYSYVEGSFNALPDFFSQGKAKTGNSANIDLGVRKQNTSYAMLWEGYINVPQDAIYTFETNSDDGSKVYLGLYNNGLSPLVNNDGNHGVQVRKGNIFLTAGVYPIAVTYYQNTGDGIMELYWSSNMGLARQLIPDNAFKSSSNNGNGNGGGSSSGNISYKYFEGSFQSLPDLSTFNPTKTGTSANFDLGVRNRNDQYAMMWQANITVPTTGTYTFETVSDDGSKLYLGNYGGNVTPMVNNDGPHGTQSRSASQYLNAGSYTITVQYFQSSGDQTMEVYWSSNTGISRQRIPDDALTPYTGTNVAIGAPTTPTTPTTPNTPSLPTTPDVSNGNESGGLTGNTNYYFSTSSGDDSRTNIQAQNPNTPWRSLDKLNSIIPYLAAGDAVLLKRGDVFDGSITIKRTSNQYNGIIISAYGTGNKPVINGFATMGNWVNSGNGVWSSYYNYTGSRINMVTLNGQTKEMGRYPNADAAVKGYLTYESHTFDNGSWTGSITDNEFSSSVNWTGAELALRKKRWVIDQCPITYQNGKTFYYKSTSFYPGIDGFGYFIQNHPKTLDLLGEWYFDPNSKYLQMYFGNNNPFNYEVKESVVDVLINILGQGNITLDNLTLQGANSKAISVGSSGSIKVSNCNVLYSGLNGLDVNYTNALTVENSVFSDTHNGAMYLGPSVNNSVVRNNKVINTGVYPGMGANSDNARTAIIIAGNTNSVEYNEVYNTGYNGIKFHGNNITVKNNLVNMFCFLADDGGGVYTYDGGMYGRKILNNVIVNGPGASDGTNSYLDYAANGIDLDDLTNDVEMTGNSIANCNGRGICNHNSHELILYNNTVYNCDMSQVEFDHDVLGPNDPVRNVNMNNNIFVSKRVDQPVLIVRTKDDDVGQMGKMNNNIFARPIDDNQTFSTFTYFNTPSVIPKTYDLAHWKAAFGYDAQSTKSPVKLAPYTVNSTSGNLYTTNSTFDNSNRNILTPTSDRTALGLDYGVLDGGALRISFTGNASNQYHAAWFWDAAAMPTLLPNRTYRVKFTAKGNIDNNTDFFGTLISAYGSGKTEAKLFKISNSRTEVELFFTPSTALTSPYFQIHEPLATECPTIWIDNMTIQEVYSITNTNPDDYMRFEYNGTGSSKSIGLDGSYVDMKNTTYNNSITLAPYTSAVLVRKGTSLVSDAEAVLSTSAPTARIMTAVEETAVADNLAAESEIKLTPNPAVDKIQLNLKLAQNRAGNKATMKIYAASGTVVNAREITVSGQPVTVDVSTLGKGVYTVNIVYGGRTITKRFVKM